MEFYCNCPSPLEWDVKKIGDPPICKNCGREVSKDRSLEEMDRKYNEIDCKIKYNNLISVMRWCIILVGITAIFVFLAYNFDTGFWFDKPLFDPDYFTFHPHKDDSCDVLRSKYELFHPEGTNPIKFEIYDRMVEKRCMVVLP